ncbi:MAG: PAS domain S-box protein, partial [Alphaproteobacteria bacterium]|nr:PAS domain S-box protein [Alphaproteobacteria bacterium]
MTVASTPRAILGPSLVAVAFVLALAAAFTTIGSVIVQDTRSTIERHLLAEVERQSERVAQQVAGGIQLLLEQINDSPGADPPPPFDAATRDSLDRRIRTLVEGSATAKVKLYSRDGTTIFSTAPADIGQKKYSPSFDAALDGRTSTELNRRDRFLGIGGEARNVVLAASYVPVRAAGATTIVEIYADVTADIAGISQAIDAHARLLGVGFLALFALVSAMTVAAVVSLKRMIVRVERQSVELASSESVFRDAIESIADGLMILDEEMQLVHWNTQVEVLFPHLVGQLRRGMPLQSILELHAASPLFGIEPGRRADWIEQCLLMLRPEHAPPPQPLADGRVVQGSARRRSRDGHIVMTRDLTAEIRARTALAAATTRAEASEARFRDFAEAASDWFWEAGPDGRLTYISAGIRRFGVEPEQLIGQRRSQLPYRVPSGQPGIARIAEATAAQQPFKDIGYEGVVHDGRHVYVAVSAVPTFDSNGVFIGHRGTGRDITDVTVSRQRLEQALQTEREAAAQQRRFIAIVAHEFRTPL